MEQGGGELVFGDVQLGDGVLLLFAVNANKPCLSIGGPLLVNFVRDSSRQLVVTEHVVTRLAFCNEHAKSVGLRRAE
jgi:hypothetical protein